MSSPERTAPPTESATAPSGGQSAPNAAGSSDEEALLAILAQRKHSEQASEEQSEQPAFGTQDAADGLLPPMLMLLAILILLALLRRNRQRGVDPDDYRKPWDKRNRGFSLLEMLLALVIVASLSAVAIPRLEAPARFELHQAARQVQDGLELTRQMARVQVTSPALVSTQERRAARLTFVPCGEDRSCFRIGRADRDPLDMQLMDPENRLAEVRLPGDVVFERRSGLSVVQGIEFDHRGRPWQGAGFAQMLHRSAEYTAFRYLLRHRVSGERLLVQVEPVAGVAHILPGPEV